jgi:hypothetical protein
MELSLFLAQLFGLTMIIFTLSALFRPKLIDGMINDLQSSTFSSMLAGFVGVIGGLAIILNHNIWEMSWVGIVTFFGWAALLKGITYIAFPDLILKTANVLMTRKSRTGFLVVALLFSCYLTYHGFGMGA